MDEAGNAKEKVVEEEEEDDDDVDHDDDERDYTPEEAQQATQCIQLMTVCQDLVKLVLGTMTTVGDSVLIQGSQPDQSSRTYSWIAQLVLVAELMERDCVDLGAELYPPVCLLPLSSQPSELPSCDEENDALVTAYRSLHKNASKTIVLLREASEIQRELDNTIVEKIGQEEEKLLTL